MKTVNEVSKLTGLSVRTLQYYDNIGLLVPSQRTRAGYRMYDDEDIEKLQLERDEKIEGVALAIKNLTAELEMLDAEEKSFKSIPS